MLPLLTLAKVFGLLGLVAVGGVMSVLPEIQRQVVEVQHWMGAEEFAGLFALTQAAPGPNVMVVALVGWRVAGLAGALVALVSLIAPPAVLAYIVAMIWQRFRRSDWVQDIQASLSAVAAGLITAGAALICLSAGQTIGLDMMMVAATAIFIRGKIQPLWLLGAGALLGAIGVV
jgi:chromate transporter